MLKRPKILVLEDEENLLQVLRIAFATEGFEVLTAMKVKEGLKHLRREKNIQIVWVDHYLIGKENGLEFVVKLKRNKKWRKIPIFVVSNTASERNIQAYLGLGVNKYYTKADYRLSEIIRDIKKFLNKKI